MDREPLSEYEHACLRRLAGRAIDDGRCCDEHTLCELVNRGLVERVAVPTLPLELRRQAYRLTLAGRARICA